MSANWFLYRDGQEYGPYTWGQLQDFRRSGEIGPGEFVKSEQMTDWLKVEAVPGLEGPLSGQDFAPHQPARKGSGRLLLFLGGGFVLILVLLAGAVILGYNLFVRQGGDVTVDPVIDEETGPNGLAEDQAADQLPGQLPGFDDSEDTLIPPPGSSTDSFDPAPSPDAEMEVSLGPEFPLAPLEIALAEEFFREYGVDIPLLLHASVLEDIDAFYREYGGEEGVIVYDIETAADTYVIIILGVPYSEWFSTVRADWDGQNWHLGPLEDIPPPGGD